MSTAARRLIAGALSTALAAQATVAILGSLPPAGAATPSGMERVSVGSSGTQGNGTSTDPCMTPNGRFAAFQSFASNLVASDTNGTADIFVRDRATGVTERVSVSSAGAEGNNISQTAYAHCLSDDGRYVVFTSTATNLVASDTNTKRDVFIHDRVTDTTERVSVGPSEQQGNNDSIQPAISGDGHSVAFASTATNFGGASRSIYVRDLVSGTTKLSAAGGPHSGAANLSLSTDGRYIGFASNATNIGGETHPNSLDDVFVYDRDLDADGVFDEAGAIKTVRVSKPTSGEFANALSRSNDVSDDGRFVVFSTAASNIVASDTNGTGDIFVHDRDADADGVPDEAGAVDTVRISVTATGAQGNGGSSLPMATGDMRYVAFLSEATNLVADDTNGFRDAFLVDRTTGFVKRVSQVGTTQVTLHVIGPPAVATGGTHVAFDTHSANLVPGDTNSTSDVFVSSPATSRRGGAEAVVLGQVLGLGGRHARNNTALRADPVNTATGSYVHQVEELTLPGIGPAFSFTRTYNSADTSDSPLGKGWTHPYNMSLIIDDATGDVVLRAEDGQQVAFTKEADGTFTGPAGGLSTLTAVTGGYELTAVDQLTYGFDDEGALTEITDEQGLALTFAYDDAGNVDTITDAAGRVFTFNHSSDGYLVEVLSPDGREVNFAYTDGLLTSSVDVRAKTTTYEYDANGLLKKVVDPLGHTEMENVYGTNGRVVSQKDPLANEATFSFDDATDTSVLTDALGNTYEDVYDGNNLVAPTDPNGNTTDTVYDADLNPITVTDTLGQVTEMTYDERGNMLTREGPAPSSITESYTYDAENHLTSYTNGKGGITTYAYDADGNLTSVTDPEANTTTYAYDADGNLVSETDPLGNITTYDYDAVGNLVEEVSPLGLTTTYQYDAAGRRTAMVDPRGNEVGAVPADFTWRWEYDAAGNVTAEVDPLGNRTEHTYDDAGNRVSTEDPNGHVTTFEYNAANELTAEVDPLGNRTEYDYDEVGNQVTVTNGESETTTYEYDGNRNLTAEVTPLGNRTTYQYDALNRRTAMVDPRGNAAGAVPADFTWAYGYDEADNQVSTTDPLGNATTSEYDANGNEVSRTDANGHVTAWEYDDADRLTAVVAPDTTRTEYEYDAAGNPTLRRDANNHETTWEYDDDGRMIAKELPLGERWTYEYDAVGNLVRQVDADGNATASPTDGITQFTYDAANRRTDIDYGDDLTYSAPVVPGVLELPQSEPTPDVEFVYDAASNRTQMHDGPGTETYAYDGANRLTSVTRGASALQYVYDQAHRVTRRTYPGGRVVDVAFDDDGRVTSVTSNGSSATQTFDESGALLTRTFSNGVVERRDYDEAGRLEEIVVEKGPEVLEEFTYALDPVGNPTQVTGPRGPENYEYDELNRLTEVCFTACALDFIRWTYDPVGNRLGEERLSGTTTYDYDDSDRLTQEHSPLGVTTAYSYDENGNQTARGSERFAYDAANHHAAHIVGPVVHRYRYDGEDKRVSAETKPAGAGAGARTDYVWDPNNAYPLLIEEAEHADAATANSRTYVHGDTEMLFSTDDPLVGDTVTRFSAHDRIGSVVALTDTDGERDSTYAYEPFGDPRPTTVESPTAPSNPMRFAGEYLDPRSALYHLRARDYDSSRGRFTRQDPLEAARREPVPSSYLYASNRPTLLTDPKGERASKSPARPSELSLTTRGRRFIQAWEGFEAYLYEDTAGNCTIGYGHKLHTGPCTSGDRARYSNGISRTQADRMFTEDVRVHQRPVQTGVTVPLWRHQFDALVSLAFNVPEVALRSSTLFRKLNQGDYGSVKYELPRWNKTNCTPGPCQTSRGLTRRRAAEVEVFRFNRYPEP